MTRDAQNGGMRPLSELRVIDLTRALSGPFCAMILADLGADVVKVEPWPDDEMSQAWGPFDHGVSAYFLSTNRNKRGKHVMQDEVWTEVVAKNDANRALPDGESGSLVYARLPMGVYVRLDDMLLVRSANVYSSHVQRSLLSVPGTGIEFKIVLERNGAPDTATVRVERDPAACTDNLAEFDSELVKLTRRRLKNDTKINFKVEGACAKLVRARDIQGESGRRPSPSFRTRMSEAARPSCSGKLIVDAKMFPGFSGCRPFGQIDLQRADCQKRS
jgi:hypothetical protein